MITDLPVDEREYCGIKRKFTRDSMYYGWYNWGDKQKTQWYDLPLLELVFDSVKDLGDNDVFIDVGANIGAYTLLLGKKGKCWAFEPVEETFEHLMNNVIVNDLLGRVSVFQEAVSDCLSFYYISYHQAHSGMNRIKEVEDDTRLRTIYLDKFYEEFKEKNRDVNIKVIKIDADGHDIHVLRGAEKLIAQHKPLLVVEHHKIEEEIKDWFENNNYKIIQKISDNYIARYDGGQE